MNIKALIKKYEELWNEHSPFYEPVPYTSMVELFLKELKQLDEPQKVKIPQFVADWIEVCKEHLTTSLYTAMTSNFMKENNQSFDLILWIKKASNQDLFARAWLDGYEVEKEKRYLVTLKNRQPLVKSQSGSTLYFSQDITARNYKGTQKELEEAKFGWVFDCEGIDIEEVE
ncbi:phage protein [Streptococcus pneumoniae]|nr:phage protein [Streptococcus pneumoniae]VRN73079.1 phage protein [Streptococcus pneumoniae]VSH11166.1 phage protein [Streptococcus pneumoniae]VTA57962.1 phage protein [Streptococcus pneumoniae]